jgi:hypothetical protein
MCIKDPGRTEFDGFAELYCARIITSTSHTVPLHGRSTRIRTLDPLVPNQVRYQTAPHSDELVAGGGLEHTQAELMRLTFTLNPRD